jgi:hypothetical protein
MLFENGASIPCPPCPPFRTCSTPFRPCHPFRLCRPCHLHQSPCNDTFISNRFCRYYCTMIYFSVLLNRNFFLLLVRLKHEKRNCNRSNKMKLGTALTHQTHTTHAWRKQGILQSPLCSYILACKLCKGTLKRHLERGYGFTAVFPSLL